MADKKYLNLEGLAVYDTLLKQYISNGFNSKEAADLATEELKDYINTKLESSMTITELGED